jgi:hypothetical protein
LLLGVSDARAREAIAREAIDREPGCEFDATAHVPPQQYEPIFVG